MIVWIGPCYSCEVVGQPDVGRGLVGLACLVCIYIYIYIYTHTLTHILKAISRIGMTPLYCLGSGRQLQWGDFKRVLRQYRSF